MHQKTLKPEPVPAVPGKLTLEDLGISRGAVPSVAVGLDLVSNLERRFKIPPHIDGLKKVFQGDDLAIAVDSRRWYVGTNISRETEYFTVVAYPRSIDDRQELRAASVSLVPGGPSGAFPGSVGCFKARAGIRGPERTIEVGMIQTCLRFSHSTDDENYNRVDPRLSALAKRHIDWRENAFEVFLDLTREDPRKVFVPLDKSLDPTLANHFTDESGNYKDLTQRVIARALDNGFVTLRYTDKWLTFIPRFAGLEIPTPDDRQFHQDPRARLADPFRRGHLCLATEQEALGRTLDSSKIPPQDLLKIFQDSLYSDLAGFRAHPLQIPPLRLEFTSGENFLLREPARLIMFLDQLVSNTESIQPKPKSS